MPIVTEVRTPDGKKLMWSCCMNVKGKAPRCDPCGRCVAYKWRTRERCKNRTCTGSLCWFHLARPYRSTPDDDAGKFVGLRIAKSTIPNSGYGLFATRDIAYGESIMPFTYEKVTSAQLRERYSFVDDDGTKREGVAPYGFDIEKSRDEKGDAMCMRNAPSYANDKTMSKGRPPYGSNAVIRPHTHGGVTSVWLEARKAPAHLRKKKGAIAIKKGSEVFVSYGKSYWGAATHVRVVQRRVSAKPSAQGGASKQQRNARNAGRR